MSNPKTAGLTVAGLLVGVLAAYGAGAADVTNAQGAPQLKVQFRSSQLQTDRGVQHVLTQLQSAAERVCPQPTGLIVNETVAACRRDAVAGAVAQINNARLAALSDRTLKHG